MKRIRIDPEDPESYAGYKRYLNPGVNVEVPIPRRTRYRAQLWEQAHGSQANASGDEADNDNPPPPQDEASIYNSPPPQHYSSDEESSSNLSSTSSTSNSDEEQFSEDDNTQSDLEETSEEKQGKKASKIREEMKENYDLDGIIKPEVTLSRFAILVMVLHFVKRFGISDVGLEALLEMINLVLGAEVIPASKFIFKRVFASDTRRKFYLYCSKCMRLLGESTECKLEACPVCSAPVDLKTLNKGNFFVGISMEDQIRDRLQRPGGDGMISYRHTRIKDDQFISDVFDALCYKDLEATMMPNSSFLTTFMSTDGADVFISSNKSVWPVQYFINEIPPAERFNSTNIMCASFWFGKSTISMVTYLSFIIEELNKLATDGVKWFNALLNEEVVTKVYCLHFGADAPAKAKVMCMKQFNGKFSCHMCEHEGETLGPKNVRFGHLDQYIPRTEKSIRDSMKEAQNSGQIINGMKGVSPLYYFPTFQLPYGVGIDYMHTVLLGVCKSLVEKIWCNSENSDEEFYLDNRKRAKIDKRILALRPPSTISRAPRPLSNFSLYKANEWRSWLFYYGPVVLHGILPDKYYRHFCLLSASIYFFCQEKIDRDRIKCFQDFLYEFVKQFHEIYTIRRMTYNVHMIVHIGEIVTSCGPLWCTSLFPVEGGNMVLLQMIMGANGVQQQLVVRYCIYNSIPEVLAEHAQLPALVSNFCKSILPERKLESADSCSGITIKGNKFSEEFRPSEEEQAAMVRALPEIDVDEVYLIQKIIYQRRVFVADNPAKPTKKDNTFAVLQDGRCIKILKFFISSLDYNKLYLIGKLLKFEENSAPVFGTPHFHLKLCQPYPFQDEMIVISADLIHDQCVFMVVKQEEGNDISFLSLLPNRFEKD